MNALMTVTQNKDRRVEFDDSRLQSSPLLAKSTPETRHSSCCGKIFVLGQKETREECKPRYLDPDLLKGVKLNIAQYKRTNKLPACNFHSC